jgi:excisionase family DNA binding protein
MAESVIMVTMTIPELQNMIRSAVNEAVQKEFAPLRRQFEDRLIDRKEAAQVLGVTLSTLHNWHNNGTLSHVKIGGSVKYRESDITAYLSRK